MQPGRPSRTALAAAGHRAAHQVLEGGSLFSDPFAIRILGADAETALRRAAADPAIRELRLFIAIRTRFAEDALAAAVGRGVRQVVVLGAGLDTYAYRSTGAGIRIFEVDHPATQAWKRRRLADVAIALPSALTFAPVDFERETLGPALDRAGFDGHRRTFFTWLGVVPYLTEPSILATLQYMTDLPGGAEVVFDYSNPLPAGAQDPRAARHEALARRAARVGEPLKSDFDTRELQETLVRLGFADIEDLGPSQIGARYFPGRRASARNHGGHVVRAATA